LLDSKNAEELGLMASDPAKLARQLGREDTMFQTRAQATGGSLTADKQADAANMIGQTALGGVNALRGNFTGLIGAAVAKFANLATGKNPATREAIARMLISQDPRAVLAPAIRAAANLSATEAKVAGIIRSALRTPTGSAIESINAQ
jgi:hypothetical protein